MNEYQWKNLKHEVACWVTALVCGSIVMLFIVGFVGMAKEKAPAAKEELLDAAAKASVSWEERKDNIRNEQ